VSSVACSCWSVIAAVASQLYPPLLLFTIAAVNCCCCQDCFPPYHCRLTSNRLVLDHGRWKMNSKRTTHQSSDVARTMRLTSLSRRRSCYLIDNDDDGKSTIRAKNGRGPRGKKRDASLHQAGTNQGSICLGVHHRNTVWILQFHFTVFN
jgi:hypothetical protein